MVLNLDLNNINDPSVIKFYNDLDKSNLNDLEKFFYFKNHRLIYKVKHYFEIYDRHFSKFRGKDITVVEIGVYNGGSLQMWKDYFGPNCKVIGVDISPTCKQFEEENIEIIIGSQEDVNFLNELKLKVPKIDILIDDGGHTMNQQITTFESLFPHISENGVYLCEDLVTSYWDYYGGGYKNKNSFIEYSKNFIDFLNSWHSQSPDLQINEFTKSAHSLHYYDSMLVIEKRKITHPINIFSKYTQ